MHACNYVYMYVLHLFIYVCGLHKRTMLCERVYKYICIYIDMYINIYTHIHIYIYIIIYTYIYANIHIYIQMYIFIYIYMYTYIYIYIHMQTYVYVYIDMYIGVFIFRRHRHGRTNSTSRCGLTPAECISGLPCVWACICIYIGSTRYMSG